MNNSEKQTFHVHLVSDATGETINNIARACLAQFEHVNVKEHYWSLVRTKRQLDLVAEGLRQWPGIVFYTFVDDSLSVALQKMCERMDLPSLSILEPILRAMKSYFGSDMAHEPGKQHDLDEEYFARIDAMEYALSFDDGQKTDKLDKADVIILGVSRTSKTPTCVYLSQKGIKAANVPIVPGVPLSIDFSKLKKPLVVGLTRDPEVLAQTRRARLHFLPGHQETDYTNPDKVREEVKQARKMFAQMGIPVIDATRRSIEETAAEIMMLLNKRKMEKEIGALADPQTEAPS